MAHSSNLACSCWEFQSRSPYHRTVVNYTKRFISDKSWLWGGKLYSPYLRLEFPGLSLHSYLFIASHEKPESFAEVDEARDEAFVGNHRAHVRVSSFRQILKTPKMIKQLTKWSGASAHSISYLNMILGRYPRILYEAKDFVHLWNEIMLKP